METKTTKERGNQAEQLACEFLLKQQLKLIDRNYHSRQGEIDLIMLDNTTLVFIEVRYRQSGDFMSALETINQQKCQRIIATAQHFILHEKGYNNYDLRFDVVLITGLLSKHEIEWIQDAFQA